MLDSNKMKDFNVMSHDDTLTIRERIRRFSLAFGRPVNESYTPVSVEERELLGKLLLEECVEYVVKGLGCDVKIDFEAGRPHEEGYFRVEHREGVPLNPLEIADGLADVNVVVNFNSHWHGINLDRATAIVDDSNMSKLDNEGKPIINVMVECDECEGRGLLNRDPDDHDRCGKCGGKGRYLRDPSKPVGKILKSPNFFPPEAGLSQLLAEVGQNAEGK